MTTFYICRHGQTENNANTRLSGWIDTPLTGIGIQNAHHTAALLKQLDVHFDGLISSDLGRAFTTAYIIARDLDFTKEIMRYPGLRDVNYGELANCTYDKYPSVTPEENTDFKPEGGESLAELQARVLATLETIAQVYPGKTILLVAHDGTINAIRAAFSGESIGVVDAKQLNSHEFLGTFQYDDAISNFQAL